jgi:type II secretory pathway component PulM
VTLAQTTNALPDNTGYVAAAYLVFFALVLIYVLIMASKLARFERELAELNELADQRTHPATAAADAAAPEPEEAARR